MRCLLLLSMLVFPLYDIVGQSYFGVMTYNCENAFDTIHDEGCDDLEYTPNGLNSWKRDKFYNKIRNISKVIMSADSIQPVDLICLCEIENDTVMEWLTKRTALRSIGYEYEITHSLDRRGIDVALMFLPFTFKRIESQSLRYSSRQTTRDVLRVSGMLMTGDTLDVYAVHLPSKLNGRESAMLRKEIVKMVRSNVDSIISLRTNPQIIVIGDFNDNPKSNLMRKELAASALKTDELTQKNKLYNLTSSCRYGTYKYQGHWNTIDQIISNGTLLNKGNGIVFNPNQTRIVNNAFLLEEDTKYGGVKPKRSFLGNFYRKTGFSDHLPVYARFTYNY